jgi:hypothetical protein
MIQNGNETRVTEESKEAQQRIKPKDVEGAG